MLINLNQFLSEEWRPIPGFEGIYEASNLGRIKRLRRVLVHNYGGDRILKEKLPAFRISGNGYYRIRLTFNKQKTFHFVHRLIAAAFMPCNDPSKQINHKDCNKFNNCIDNLEWVSGSENMKHAYRNGRISKLGELNSCAKLNIESIQRIRIMILNGMNNRQIADCFDVGRSTISLIRNKKLWGHVN